MASIQRDPKELVDHLYAVSQAKAFLGTEFLTWLWFSSENDAGKIRFEDPYETGRQLHAEFWVDDKLILQSSSGLSHEQILKGGDPSKSGEAATALVSGKHVREMRIGVRIKPYGEFLATLAGGDLKPRSIKLPDPSNPETYAEPETPLALTRLMQTEVFLAFLQRAFAKFMKVRLKDTWEKGDWTAIKNWIKSRRSGELFESDAVH